MPAKPTKPNSTTQLPSAYKAAIDAHAEACHRTATAWAPHAQDTPNMTVRLEAGAILSGTTLTEVDAQNTGTMTAPTTNPRIDRVVIDKTTGAVSVITGTPGASPSPPAITTGKLPVAQVLLTVGMTAITNADITDERVPGGAGVTIGSIASPSSTEVASTQDVATALAAVQDTEARDLAAFNAFVAQIAAGRATGPVPNGGIWLFATDEMTKTNAVYDAGVYRNAAVSSVTNTLANGTLGGSGDSTNIDLNISLPAGTLYKVQIYSASATTNTRFQVWRLVSGNQYSFVGQSQAFNLAVGLNTIYLDTPITTQSGDRPALATTGGVPGYTTGAGSVVYVSSRPTTTTTFTPATGTLSFGVFVITAVTNMTLVSPAGVALGFVPTKATLYLLHKSIDSLTYNTDIMLKAARGGSYAQASDLAKLCAYDATYDILKATVDLSALASGSTGLWGLDTYNTKSQQVRAALALFE